jgi:hypothetical protein
MDITFYFAKGPFQDKTVSTTSSSSSINLGIACNFAAVGCDPVYL